jgi:hypothetical protein
MPPPSPDPGALFLLVLAAAVLMALLWVARRRAVDASFAPERFPLHAASARADALRVAELLAAGADPNERDEAGMTPLLHAVYCGHPGIVALLCEGGADVNAREATGETALWHAEDDFGLTEVAAVLRRHGATEK